MKTLLALLLLIPSLSFANEPNENQVRFSLFGFSINEIFKKDEYQFVMWNFGETVNGEQCKIIDVDSNFNKSCYKTTITHSVMLSPETPPLNPNKHFYQYYIDYEQESLIINSIRAYSGRGDIKTKKECIAIRDVIYKKLKEKYVSSFYKEKYKIYISKTGDDFDDKNFITIYDKEKFATDDMYSIQFELFCYFSDIENEDIGIKASLSRDYPRSVIEKSENKDIDTSGF